MAVQKLPVSRIEAGMVAAQDIYDDRGRIILNSGGRLTPMIIKRFDKWGIEEVAVQTEEEAEAEKKKEAAKSTAQSIIQSASEEDRVFMRRVAMEVQQRFANVEDSPVMMDLRRYAIRHLIMNGRGVVPGLK